MLQVGTASDRYTCQIIGTGKLPQIAADCRRLPQIAAACCREQYRWKTVELARVVKPTNHDFPCPAQKIAIGSLSASALAALATSIQALPVFP